MENALEEIKSRLDEAEDRVSELEDRQKKTPRQSNKRKKRLRKNEHSLRELQDNMNHNNICIIGTPEGDEKEQRIENLFEKVMTENFPNLMRGKFTQVQEVKGPQLG